MVKGSEGAGQSEALAAAQLPLVLPQWGERMAPQSRQAGGRHVKAQALGSPLWTDEPCWSPPPAQVPLRLHTSQGDTSSFLSRRMQAADGTETRSQRICFWARRSARFAGGWVGPAQRPSASSPCGFGGTGKKWMAPLASESFGYWRPRERTRI